MKIYFEFFEEQNLLVQKFKGEWDLNTLIDYHHFLVKQKQLGSIKKIFTDFRGVSLLPVHNDLLLIANLRDDFHKNIDRIVHLLDLPDSTAMSMLYSDILTKKGHKSFTCSTIKLGLKILELDYSENQLEAIFDNLNNKFPSD